MFLKKVSVGVERRRGRGLKARGGRRDAPGKVLKEWRSPRERGRMGTSVQQNAPDSPPPSNGRSRAVSPALMTSSSIASRTRQKTSVAPSAPSAFAAPRRSDTRSRKNDGQRVGYSRLTRSAATCASLFFTNAGTGGSVLDAASAIHPAIAPRNALASASDSDPGISEPLGCSASASVCRHQNRTSG